MSADYAIHLITDEFTMAHARAFASNSMGSKHFLPGYDRAFEERYKCSLYEMAGETPNHTVGEVSFLKAALCEDSDTFVPSAITNLCDIITDDFPVIDDDLIEKVKGAFVGSGQNASGYEADTRSDDLVEFLEQHRGGKVFSIAW